MWGWLQKCAIGNRSPTMPLLVDGVDDKVGNAYSGMPGRLYVLDRKGKVAYKSGRGPYGFKAGEELEQALVMALLESMPARQAPSPEIGSVRCYRCYPVVLPFRGTGIDFTRRTPAAVRARHGCGSGGR